MTLLRQMHNATFGIAAVLFASTCWVAIAQAAELPKLVVTPPPRTTPGYDQLVDPQTKLPRNEYDVIYDQVDRLCLRLKSDPVRLAKLAKTERWTAVDPSARKNQFELKASGKPFNRGLAWEFYIGRVRYYLGLTLQPAYSILDDRVRDDPEAIIKCELKVDYPTFVRRESADVVFTRKGWALIGTPKGGVQVFSSQNWPVLNIILLKDYSSDAAEIEIIVM